MANEFADIAKDMKREQVRKSMYLAVKSEPDTEAQLQALSTRTGIPVDAIRLKRDEVTVTDRLNSIDIDKTLAQAPKVSAWLADPSNAAVAHDDTASLSKLEQLTTTGRDIAGAAAQGVIGQGAGATLSGLGELYSVAVRGTSKALDALLPDGAMEALKSVRIPWFTDPQQILKRPGKELKQVGEALGPPVERQTLATDVAAGIGQLGFQIAAYLTTGGASSSAMLLSQGADIVADKTAKDDGTGRVAGAIGMDAETARDTAIVSGGAVTLLTEKYGIDKLLNRVPPAIKNRTLRFIADKLAAGGIEAAQEFTEGLLHDVARRTLTNEDAIILEGVDREMSAAALSAMIVRTALGVKGHRQAKHDEQLIQALGDESKNSTLRERLPEKYQALVERLTKGGPVENLYIPADRFATYFQAQGADPAQMAEALGATNYVDATASGGDITIPMSRALTDLAPSDHLQGLMQDLRFDPDMPTAREAQQFESQREDSIKAELTQMQADGAEAAKTLEPMNAASELVYQDTLTQLLGTGMEKGTAERNAMLNKAAFRALATSINEQRATEGAEPIDSMTLYRPYETTIQRLSKWSEGAASQQGKAGEAFNQQEDIEGSTRWAIEAYKKNAVPDGWFVHGRNNSKSLTTGNVIQATKSLDVADSYAGKSGSVWFLRPKSTAKLLDFSSADSPDLDEIIELLQKDIDRGLGPSGLSDDNAESYRASFSPENLVNSAGAFDDIELVQWLINRADADVVIVDGGAIALNVDAIDAVMAQSVGHETTFNQGDAPPQSEQAETFNQDVENRGAFSIGKDRRVTISLFEGANLSTFLHESGHFYLEVLADVSARPDAPQRMKDDFATLTQFAGMEPDAWRAATLEQRREGHEKVARAFEAYLMEGKAPSTELQAAFARFSLWLKRLYRDMRGLNVQLNDDVRAVFDRLLATDSEIEAAKEQQQYKELFLTQQDSGMSPQAWKAYRATVEDAHAEAVSDMSAKMLKTLQREQQADWKERLDKMQAVVEAEANKLPVYVAQSVLKKGTLPDGSPLPETMEPIKLDKAALESSYGKATKANTVLSGLRGMTSKEGGLHQDAAAERFGFKSGDEMIQAVLNAPSLKQYIKDEALARLRAESPDPMTDGSAADVAMSAIHNQKRAEVLLLELKALKRKQKEVKPFLNAAKAEERNARNTAKDTMPTRIELASIKSAAEQMIEGKRIRDINPTMYRIAEAKASRAAFELAGKKKWDEAYAAKRQQIVSHYLYVAASAAKDKVATIREDMAGMSSKRVQEMVGKASPQYLDALNGILDGYEFRRVSKKVLDLRDTLRLAVAKAEAEGEVIDVLTDEEGRIVDPALLNVRNYQELTYAELLSVRDTATNIVHVARQQGKFRAAEVKAQYDDLAAEGLAEIEAGTKRPNAERRSLRTPWQDKKRFVAGLPQSWRGLYSYIEKATGYEETAKGLNNTTLWKYIVLPLNEAAAKEAVMLHEASTRLDEIFAPYATTYLYGKGKKIPGFEGSLNKQEQIMIAASAGTEIGQRRLLENGLDGKGFTQPELDAILDSLDAQDWQTVTDLWQFMGSYWPHVADKQERITGVRPQGVEPLPIKTKFGDMSGGYSPIAYETLLDNKAAAHDSAAIAKEMNQAAYTRSTTRRGFLKDRVKSTKGRPVRYDFGVVYKHLNEVMHDLTHHEALRDVQKLLNHKVAGTSVLDAITERLGAGVRDEIRQTLEDIAVGNLRQMTNTERFMERLAKGATIAGLAYNVWSALQNATGIMNSMAVIGPKAVFSGAAEWIGSPKHMLDTIDSVNEKSQFMRTRFLNMNRDIATFKAKMEERTGVHGVDKVYSAFRDGGFWMMVRMQQLVDTPTWLGAYRSALRSDPTMTEANAVALADQAVIAAQGGGRNVDLSQFMRAKGWGRVWTVYAGYFNTTYQRVVESMERAGVQGYSAQSVGRAVTDMFFLSVAPVMLTVLLKEAINVGVGGEPEDEDGIMLKLLKEQAGYMLAMFPFLRETAAGFLGYGPYSGPVGARFFKETNDLARQAMQGDVDENLIKEGVGVAGYAVGLPTTQLVKVYEGFQAMDTEDATPLALVFGPPKD